MKLENNKKLMNIFYSVLIFFSWGSSLFASTPLDEIYTERLVLKRISTYEEYIRINDVYGEESDKQNVLDRGKDLEKNDFFALGIHISSNWNIFIREDSCHRESLCYIGVIGFDLDELKDSLIAEQTTYLGADFQKRGYGTEARKAMITQIIAPYIEKTVIIPHLSNDRYELVVSDKFLAGSSGVLYLGHDHYSLVSNIKAGYGIRGITNKLTQESYSLLEHNPGECQYVLTGFPSAYNAEDVAITVEISHYLKEIKCPDTERTEEELAFLATKKDALLAAIDASSNENLKLARGLIIG